MMARVAVVILNWNGGHLLNDFLPSVLAGTTAGLGRVVMVDNASEDDSLEVMKRDFPQVDLVCFDRNYGFAGGYNRMISQLDEEIVVLLNSDVETSPHWLEPLVEALDKDPSLVAVQPKILSWHDRGRFEYAGASGGFIDRLGFPFCRGRILDVTEKDEGQYDDMREVFWCSGAALCIRRKAYLEAGGLDERFFAHMEEIDLCWRLRNAGWKLAVCPSSSVYHLGGGSLPMNHPRKLFLNYRNNLLMLYKNLSRKEWLLLEWQRLVLDSGAMFLFLLKGEGRHALAVVQAYREFIRMKRYYAHQSSEHIHPTVYPGSIIFQFYFRRISRFSSLWK